MANGDSNGRNTAVRITIGGLALTVPVALFIFVFRAISGWGQTTKELEVLCTDMHDIKPRLRMVETTQAQLGGEIIAEIRNVNTQIGEIKEDVRELRTR